MKTSKLLFGLITMSVLIAAGSCSRDTDVDYENLNPVEMRVKALKGKQTAPLFSEVPLKQRGKYINARIEVPADFALNAPTIRGGAIDEDGNLATGDFVNPYSAEPYFIYAAFGVYTVYITDQVRDTYEVPVFVESGGNYVFDPATKSFVNTNAVDPVFPIW